MGKKDIIKQEKWKEYEQLWRLRSKIQSKFAEWNKRITEIETIFKEYLPSIPIPAEFEAEKNTIRNIWNTISDILFNEMEETIPDEYKWYLNEPNNADR